MSSKPRAICSGCRGVRTLRSDGNVRYHEVWKIFQWGSARDECDGVGKPPVSSPTADGASTHPRETSSSK